MEPKASRCDAFTQTIQIESNCGNSGIMNRVTYLSKTLEQKEDLLKLLSKEKSILECERDLVKKKQLSAEKDKEYIVMRFATAEKKIIDLESQLEEAEGHKKKILKERDTLINKLEAAIEEKLRISAALDFKCQEHLTCLKTVEILKTEVSSLETKYKWSTLKLRKEIGHKNAFETEVQENLGNNQQPESIISCVRSNAEFETNPMMLTHDSKGQLKEIHNLKKQIEKANEEFKLIKTVLANHDEEQERIFYNNEKLDQENLDFQKLPVENVSKIVESEAKINSVEVLNAQLDMLKKENCDLVMCKQLIELRDDINKLRERETELLAQNQEIGLLNAKLQNDIYLYGFKNLATSLANYRANQIKYEYKIRKVQAELKNEKKSRFEERLAIARHLAEKMKENDKLLHKLYQASEDINEMRKKHASLVRDLQREITSLQKSWVLQRDT